MSLVEFKDVYKIYKMGEVTINAVEGVSFNIEQGEFCVVVGASGAGKTTVLNILGGMDTCTKGSIIVGGRDISKLKDKHTDGLTLVLYFSFITLCLTLPQKKM